MGRGRRGGEMAKSELEEAIVKCDAGVLKRLKFVLKILKSAVTAKNRAVLIKAYLMEIFDGIGDWSGSHSGNSPVLEMVEEQVFPEVCRLISDYSSSEFDTFQKFLLRYTLIKWKETSNFIVLEFISSIYGFIVKIAPSCVVDEYLELFMREEMPPHISLVVLPELLHNLPDAYILKNGFQNLSPFLSKRPQKLHTEDIVNQTYCLWQSILEPSAVSSTDIMVSKSTPFLRQCICSSAYLDSLPVENLLNIIESLSTWGKSTTVHNIPTFLLVSTIFISEVYDIMLHDLNLSVSLNSLLDSVVCSFKKCQNDQVVLFIVRVLQRILENSSSKHEEIIKKLQNVVDCNINEDNEMELDEDSSDEDEIYERLENCFRKLTCREFLECEDGRKKIKLAVEHLQGLCGDNDQVL